MNVVTQNPSSRPSARRSSEMAEPSAVEAASPLDHDDPVSGVLSEAESTLGLILDVLDARFEDEHDKRQASDIHGLLVALQARLRYAQSCHSFKEHARIMNERAGRSIARCGTPDEREPMHDAEE